MGAVHGHFAGVSYAVNSPPFIYNFLNLSILNPISKIVADLNQFMLEQLFGYATTINQLAEEKLADRLVVTLLVMGISGEPQTSAISDNVVAAFGVWPKNRYISTETLLIGFSQSPNSGFTVYSDLNWCELLDDNNASVQLHQLGHIIITNLFNLATTSYGPNDLRILYIDDSDLNNPIHHKFMLLLQENGLKSAPN